MLDRFYRALPIIYLVWALPLLLTTAWLMPPWSNPDEVQHMLRIVELAHGELMGHRVGDHDAGGLSDQAVIDAAAPFNALPFHAERKVSGPMVVAGAAVRWHDTPSVLAFSYTARYPPWFYLPSVVAVQFSRLFGVAVDHALYLARMITALAAAAVSAGAIALAGRTRYALATLAILPMTCTLDTSASQDALLIAFSLLVVGWIDRLIEQDRAAGWAEIGLLVVTVIAIGMARPPYVAFALLPLLTAPRLRWRDAAAGGTIIAAIAVWSTVVAAVNFVARSDPSAQAQVVFADPLHFAAILWHTLVAGAPNYATQFIGQLGWLDTVLPRWYIHFAMLVLAVTFAAAAAGRARRPWLPCLAVAGAILLMFIAFYLTWTMPGTGFVEGVQGRYFIPLAAVLVLAVPGLARPIPMVGAVAPLSLGLLGAITPFVIVHALVLRYYLTW